MIEYGGAENVLVPRMFKLTVNETIVTYMPYIREIGDWDYCGFLFFVDGKFGDEVDPIITEITEEVKKQERGSILCTESLERFPVGTAGTLVIWKYHKKYCEVKVND